MHDNNYYTLYAHLEKGLSLKKGDTIKKGQFLGNMSDSGNAYGKHLHFEVIKDNIRLNPIPYLSSSFDKTTIKTETKYKIGDTIKINGVYISSTSNNKLSPAITSGTITKIIPTAKNPYLLDNGKIGWVNDNCIISTKKTEEIYLSNPNYYGFSIVDALNLINIDSSYQYRLKLAQANGIENYTGTAIQNTKMLELLKKGKLKKF